MLPVFDYPPSEMQRNQDLRPVYSYLYRLAEELNNQLLTTKNEAVDDTIAQISEMDLILALQQSGSQINVAEITRRVEQQISALEETIAETYATKTALETLAETVTEDYATKTALETLAETVTEDYATKTELANLSDDVDEALADKVGTDDLFDLVHPIGSYLLYGPGADPNGVLPGEWQLAEDTANWSIWERITPTPPTPPEPEPEPDPDPEENNE